MPSLKKLFASGSLLTRFIIINVAAWLLVSLVLVVCFLFNLESKWLLTALAFPGNALQWLHRPWTLITYMFVHVDPWSILFNMLWLYWMGRIFVSFFRPKQLGGLYFLGGMGGALLYLAAYALLPVLRDAPAGQLLGASAAVMAIAVGIATYAPNFEVGLLFFGRVKIKWFAIVMVLIDVVSIVGLDPAGHIAHLGGALTGVAWALAMRRGHDLTAGLNRLVDAVVSLFKPRRDKRKRTGIYGKEVSFHYQPDVSGNARPQSPGDNPLDEQRLDDILAKLKRSGYGALSDDEKEFLFTASRKR